MIGHVAVVVPAADEQTLIGGCLDALHDAVEHLRTTLPAAPSTELVVVLDNCRDRTAEIVAGYPAVRVVVSSARCVGAARALGTAHALAGRTPSGEVWTVHTDADSTVPHNWLTHMVRAADSGADLVLGTVRPDRELPLRTRRAWHALHSGDDGHRHVHGANLGIRAATLHRCGGWLPLHTGEDVDLVTRAVASGARVLRSGAIAVRTSARVEGRAPMGFSSYLRTLAAAVDAQAMR
jgi:cellulose synthase/poly-beta-1,6-N-acetylglucosamine synthase-like glycosyltransferase